jgi:hypothetical protein
MLCQQVGLGCSEGAAARLFSAFLSNEEEVTTSQGAISPFCFLMAGRRVDRSQRLGGRDTCGQAVGMRVEPTAFDQAGDPIQ